MSTVKDAKDKLFELLKKLDEFKDSDELVISLEDNCGGSYPSELSDFDVAFGSDNKVYILNY